VVIAHVDGLGAPALLDDREAASGRLTSWSWRRPVRVMIWE